MADVDNAGNNYLAAEDTILEAFTPRKIKTVTTHRCPFFDEVLLNLKRKKRKSELVFRKSENIDLKSVFEINTKTYFQKFLQKRAIYIENTLKNESAREKYALLKSLLGKEGPRCESKQVLASKFNNFLMAKIKKMLHQLKTNA